MVRYTHLRFDNIARVFDNIGASPIATFKTEYLFRLTRRKLEAYKTCSGRAMVASRRAYLPALVNLCQRSLTRSDRADEVH